jgi:hypothetical protein
MSATDQAAPDQWHVQVEPGDVRLWTLDQLDAAFKADLVDESTFVLEVGQTEWMTLGTLLGGGEDEEASAPAAAPAPKLGAQIESYTPIAPVMFHDVVSNGPNSTAPFATDIDDDAPESLRRSRKRPFAIGASIALLVAGAAAFAFTHGAPAAPEAPAVAAAAPPPPAPPPAPAADSQTAESPQQVAARLSHDQLLKLAEVDRQNAAKASALHKDRAASAARHTKTAHTKEKTPFHNGGDKYDPLNAKL